MAKDPQPTGPCENHGLAIQHLPTWPESQCKQQLKLLVVPVQGSLEKIIQNPGDTQMYITSAARLRFETAYNNNKLRIEQKLKNT